MEGATAQPRHVDVAIGEGVVGALAAKDVAGAVVRGFVESYSPGSDGSAPKWSITYSDNSREDANLLCLNERLARRYFYDCGHDGLGEEGKC